MAGASGSTPIPAIDARTYGRVREVGRPRFRPWPGRLRPARPPDSSAREHPSPRRRPIIEGTLAANYYLSLNSSLTAEQEAALEDHRLDFRSPGWRRACIRAADRTISEPRLQPRIPAPQRPGRRQRRRAGSLPQDLPQRGEFPRRQQPAHLGLPDRRERVSQPAPLAVPSSPWRDRHRRDVRRFRQPREASDGFRRNAFRLHHQPRGEDSARRGASPTSTRFSARRWFCGRSKT